MEDLDDVRRASGVVADFSNWSGISAGDNFKQMKITNKEKVFDPTEEAPKEEVKQVEKTEVVQSEISVPQVNIGETVKADSQNSGLNYDNVKDIAIRLLPTIDKIDMSNYTTYISNAIEVAKYFEIVWNSRS